MNESYNYIIDNIPELVDDQLIEIYKIIKMHNMKHTINKYSVAFKKFNNLDSNNTRWGKRVRNKNAMKLISVNEVIENIDNILKF